MANVIDLYQEARARLEREFKDAALANAVALWSGASDAVRTRLVRAEGDARNALFDFLDKHGDR